MKIRDFTVCLVTLLLATVSGAHVVDNNLTEIVIVLDRSGSMETIASDMTGGFNSFVVDQKKANGDCMMTLVQFDTKYETVYSGKSIRDVPDLKLNPRGSTALLDAIGRTIVDTQERLDGMSDPPGRVIFVVITDGLENSSSEYQKSRINELIEERDGKWQFVFLGANQDAIQEGAVYGVSYGGSLTWDATSTGIDLMWDNLSTGVSNLTNSGATTTDTFFETDIQETGD